MTTPKPEEFPESRRVITIETDAKTLERMRKEGVTEDGFTVYCDEAERLGGDNSAPSPMRYLSLSLGFWLLTQVVRYGRMMKVDITSARVHVSVRFTREGSVLAQTIRAGAEGIETRLEVESPEGPAAVAGVLRNAENGCYVMQSLANPTPVATSATLNGADLDLAAYPPPTHD